MTDQPPELNQPGEDTVTLNRSTLYYALTALLFFIGGYIVAWAVFSATTGNVISSAQFAAETAVSASVATSIGQLSLLSTNGTPTNRAIALPVVLTPRSVPNQMVTFVNAPSWGLPTAKVTVMVAAAAPDGDEISVRERIVAHQFALFCWRIEQRHHLGFAQLLPSRHSCLLNLDPGRPSDPRQRVDQRAALEAEGATDRGLGGAPLKRQGDRREFLGIDDDRATAMATVTPGRREPSLYPLLDQRPLELRQRAEDVE